MENEEDYWEFAPFSRAVGEPQEPQSRDVCALPLGRKQGVPPVLPQSSHSVLFHQKALIYQPAETYGTVLGCGDLGVIHVMLVFTKVKSTDCPRTRPSSTMVSLLGD